MNKKFESTVKKALLGSIGFMDIPYLNQDKLGQLIDFNFNLIGMKIDTKELWILISGECIEIEYTAEVDLIKFKNINEKRRIVKSKLNNDDISNWKLNKENQIKLDSIKLRLTNFNN